MKKLISILVAIVLMIGGYSLFKYFTSGEEEELIILYGGHRNNVAINEESLVDSARDAFISGGNITVIGVDGDPSVEFDSNENDMLKLPGNFASLTKKKKEQISEKKARKLLDMIERMNADDAEVDYFEALHVAEAIFNTSDRPNKKMIIYGSLLNTTGILNFAENPSLLQGDPDEIVKILKSNSALPKLSGVTVEIWGAGQTTSPQQELSYEQRDVIKNEYQAIFEASGIEKENIYFSTVASGKKFKLKNYESLPEVTLIRVGDHKISFQGFTKFSEDTGVKFKGDLAKLENPTAAKLALDPIYQYLKNSQNKILICGTTATGNASFCKALSQDRAETIRDLLVDMGAKKEQISCLGLGCNNPWHVEDTDKDGHLIEDNAKQNRTVYILDRNSDDAKSILENYS